MTDAETRRFVDSELPDLPPSSAKDPLNFLDAVIEWLHRWAKPYSAPVSLEKPAYCCFVLCDRVKQVADAHEGFSLRKYFREDTPQDVLGRVYLCSQTLQNVFSKEISAVSIEAVDNEIKQLGLTSNALVVFNAASKQALWRPSMNADLTSIPVGGDLGNQLRSEDFDAELTKFHIAYTATPQGIALPWKSASKLITKDNLEMEIRNCLFVFLKYQYKNSLQVSVESYEPTGRADLKVFFIKEMIAYFLELKVLRAAQLSKSRVRSVSKAATIKWGKEGIAQAYSYLLANDQSGTAYACCYDARGKDEEIAELVKFAKEKKVIYRRYFMFQSSPALHKSFIT